MNKDEITIRNSKRVRWHTISSGIWLLICSALFVALIFLADEYQLFGMTEVYVRGIIVFFISFAIGLWISTAVWFIQRVKKNFLRSSPGFLRVVLVFILLGAPIMLLAFLLQLYYVYGSELEGGYEWAIYVIAGIYGLFVFGSVWHLVRVFKPDFAAKYPRFLKTVIFSVVLGINIMLLAVQLKVISMFAEDLQGEYEVVKYGLYVADGILIIISILHVLIVFKKNFAARMAGPIRRRSGRAVFAIFSLSLMVGTGFMFAEVAIAAGTIPTPQSFTFEPGNVNKSVILLIGDGMGMEQIKFGSLVEYGSEGASSLLNMDYQTTVETNTIDGMTTDSAASATAIATGVKTISGQISTNWDGRDLTTILEIAQDNSYATGLVAICHLDHATPAAFAAHELSRYSYLAIANDMYEHEVDVMFGGGWDNSHFGTLISSFETDGYSYVTNETDMQALSSIPSLGLFAGGSLPSEMDRTNTSAVPRLVNMTQKAVELLNGSGGPFFLMVEGSSIDWAGHDNDEIYLAHEMIEFEKTVAYCSSLADIDPDLQVLVTADHETGGFSVSSYSFTSPLPDESDPINVLIQARTQRVSEVSVDWTTGGHTPTHVILAGKGPYTSQIPDARSNIDLFGLMRMAIEGESQPIGSNWYAGYSPLDNVILAFAGAGVALLVALLLSKKIPKIERTTLKE